MLAVEGWKVMQAKKPVWRLKPESPYNHFGWCSSDLYLLLSEPKMWGWFEERDRGWICAWWDSAISISVYDAKTTNSTFSFFTSNTLHLVSTTKTEVIPPLIENRKSWSTCKPFFTGMNYCTTGAYSNASSTESASYYPLTGDTR